MYYAAKIKFVTVAEKSTEQMLKKIKADESKKTWTQADLIGVIEETDEAKAMKKDLGAECTFKELLLYKIDPTEHPYPDNNVLIRVFKFLLCPNKTRNINKVSKQMEVIIPKLLENLKRETESQALQKEVDEMLSKLSEINKKYN